MTTGYPELVRLPLVHRGPDRRELAIVARWPLGLALVTWRYLWRVTPLHRSEEPGDASDLPAPLPAEHVDEQIGHAEDGQGELLHRRYRVVITGSRYDAAELLAIFAGTPNEAAPADAAVFRKTRGQDGDLQPGDEFLIRIPGPWNGPVRVVAATPTSFRLATLRGHLEAGQIQFSTRDLQPGGTVEFCIESWARPADRLSHVLYNHLKLAREIQLNLWVETCLGMGERAGGRVRGGVDIHTRVVP